MSLCMAYPFTKRVLSNGIRFHFINVPRSFSSSADGLSPKQDDASKTFHTGDLIEKVAEDHNLSKAEAKRIVTTIFDSITEAVSEKRVVSINNFGSFRNRTRAARNAWHFGKKETMIVPAKQVIQFKPSSVLKESLNTKD